MSQELLVCLNSKLSSQQRVREVIAVVHFGAELAYSVLVHQCRKRPRSEEFDHLLFPTSSEGVIQIYGDSASHGLIVQRLERRLI